MSETATELMNDVLSAEEMLIGACLYPNDAFRDVAKIVRADDFSTYRLGQIFRILTQLDFNGELPEPGTVAELFPEYEVRNFTSADLWRILDKVPSAQVGVFYATKVHDDALRRKASALLYKANQALQHPGMMVPDILAELSTKINSLMKDTNAQERIDPKLLLNIMDDDVDYDWLVPGLLEKGDRMIWTGPEGFGKTTLLRLLAILLAAGIHPLTGDKMERPMKILYIDPENSKRQWIREVRNIVRTAARYGMANPLYNIHLAITPRLNLVEGYDLGRIHRLIDEHEPDILFCGPLSKLTKGSLNNEDDAAALINAFDSLHDRGLALIMEAHAAKGTMGGRNWTPRGSAALASWPEFGLALIPDPDNKDLAIVERWRGDRDAKRLWPKQYERGVMYPWMPVPE